MAKFHVNDKGEAGQCSATKGNCPFGGEDAHHKTPEAAREAYEKSQPSALAPKMSKPPVHEGTIPENWAKAKATIYGNFDQCQAEARRLTLEGQFAVVEAYYDASMADYEYMEEPYEDNFDTPEAYEEAQEEYDNWYENQSSSSYGGPDEVDVQSYSLSYETTTFESREEFEEKLKDGSAAQYGSGNSIICFPTEEENGKVASDIDVDPYNEGRIFYYELFTYDNAK